MGIFETDIKKLYGVGAARASHYASLGISSVGDLILHYPRGYEDRGNIKLLAESDGETKFAYLLTVATVPKSVRVKGRMTLYTLLLLFLLRCIREPYPCSFTQLTGKNRCCIHKKCCLFLCTYSS